MKKIVSAFVLVFFVVGTALAADVMTFPAKIGNVTFNHKKHQEMLKNNCKACHAKAPGKMPGFGKDVAHKLCWDCHKTKSGGKGPVTNCKGCHKK